MKGKKLDDISLSAMLIAIIFIQMLAFFIQSPILLFLALGLTVMGIVRYSSHIKYIRQNDKQDRIYE